MTPFWLSALVACASLVSAITTAAQVPGPACTNDSLLRLLKSNQREFQPFCQKFLESVSPSVVTRVKTDTVTVTSLYSTTLLNVKTTRQTTYSTTVVATVTTTRSPGVKFINRRNRATTALSKYPAASISSACSCLRSPCGGRKRTTKVVAAASTVTSKATTTRIKASTTTLKQTTTTTQVTTVVESATSTRTVDPPLPT